MTLLESVRDTVAAIRVEVAALHAELPRNGLVAWTAGNVSARVPGADLLVIKPSGVSYDDITPDNMVVTDLAGTLVDGELAPSSDTAAHAYVYANMPDVNGIVHTHSTYATAWAQAGREIPVLGTTHADFSAAPVPVTRPLTAAEIDAGYEEKTGTVLIEAAAGRAEQVPAVLVRGHAPFCWGASAASAVEAAVTLEEVARMALLSLLLVADPTHPRPLDAALRDKHFERKHGAGAYYGQS